MSVLVVGGAGYIGSHMVKMSGMTGHNVVTLNTLQLMRATLSSQSTPMVEVNGWLSMD